MIQTKTPAGSIWEPADFLENNMISVYVVMNTQNPKLASRQLLNYALSHICDTVGELLHDKNGKPYILGGPEISVSHTRAAAAVAVGKMPVGVDLECIRRIRPDIAQRVMSTEEYVWYQSEGSRIDDFLTLWTLKESYYKYLGTGLPGFPNKTRFYQNMDEWTLEETQHKFFTWRNEDLFVTLCCDEQEVSISWLKSLD